MPEDRPVTRTTRRVAQDSRERRFRIWKGVGCPMFVPNGRTWGLSVSSFLFDGEIVRVISVSSFLFDRQSL